MGVQVVWLKRDLRMDDHVPLRRAAQAGPLILLYVFEPELWSRPEWDSAHLRFVAESLDALDGSLQPLGGRVVRRTGRVRDVLGTLRGESAVRQAGGLGALWSHEETGNLWTYARDRRIARWCREEGIAWCEVPQEGVFRRLRERDGWAGRWERRMGEPLTAAPERLAFVDVASERTPAAERLGVAQTEKTAFQRGGEDQARRVLDHFLAGDVGAYPYELSRPETAVHSCSRLSPHLAFGTVSVRRVHQEVQRELRGARRQDRRRAAGLEAFGSRLRWRGHFMQKLEDEPELERRNMARSMDALRQDSWNDAYFEAWCAGRTGYPLVDACMRSVRATGWLNFRMRAMLASFASYHLWLPWQRPARFLARQFLDFEPGIHFPQFQMQSGTTGINRLRIYNPIKQAREQDPDGAFIRRWVPELEGVPRSEVHAPHMMGPLQQLAVGCVIGRDYPEPIVRHGQAVRSARRAIETIRGTGWAREEARRVHQRHGSRRGPMRRPTR